MNAPSPVITDAPRLGIPCPGCNAIIAHVLFTRPRAGEIVRTRKCEVCRLRVRTAERVISHHTLADNSVHRCTDCEESALISPLPTSATSATSPD